jgi:hypothetical protein
MFQTDRWTSGRSQRLVLNMTTKLLVAVAGVLMAVSTLAPEATAQPPRPAPIFSFESDESWLNLHHFLYLLGRAEAKMPDAGEGVALATADAERGLKNLSDDERKTWGAAVTTYASGFSKLDAVRGEPFPAITAALAMADDAPALSGIDAAAADTLTRVAPIYRKAWWPAHRAANHMWQSAIETLIARHGATVRDILVKWYGLPWPSGGYAVHLSGYSVAVGAYSSTRGVLVFSSLDPTYQNLNGLEMIFHEAMHQWDGPWFSTLNAQAKTLNVGMPFDLPHAMIFFTAGEAVRRVEPSHMPTVDTLNIWSLRLSGAQRTADRLKGPLEETWRPYLDGRGTRDEALAALLARVGVKSAQ